MKVTPAMTFSELIVPRKSLLRQLRRYLKRYVAHPLLTLLPADALVAFGALYLCDWIFFAFALEQAAAGLGSASQRAGFFAFCIVIGLATMGLYRARQRATLLEGIARVLAAVVTGTIACVLLFYVLPALSTGRLALGASMLLCVIALITLRPFLLCWLDHNPLKRRVLIFGSGSVASKVGLLRRRSDQRQFQIVGFIPSSEAERDFAQVRGMGPLLAVDADLNDERIDEVVMALDDRSGTIPIAQQMWCQSRDLPIYDIVEFLEHEASMIDLDVLPPNWPITSKVADSRRGLSLVKRMFDLVVGTGILVVTSPLMLLVVASIWVEEGFRAPLLYRQRRVGLGQQVFELFKFRSMSIDAEKLGPQWASRQNDNRVTRTGSIIRRFRIDELPQLVNVILGDMSLVGPRPERPVFVDQLNKAVPLYDYRHCMQPGLAGWAQLNFPYGASIEDATDKLKYDLFYTKNAGVLFDVMILMQTLEVVIWGRSVAMAGPRPAQHRERKYSHSLADIAVAGRSSSANNLRAVSIP